MGSHTLVMETPAPMKAATFRRFSGFIQENLGIKMPDTKLTMLQSRFLKRLRALRMTSYEHYCDYVFSREGQREELQHMIDLVTTNKTEFFREPKHFDFLTDTVLPQWIDAARQNRIDVWSAGCSTGQEPYSLAMVLSEFAREHRGFGFSLLATDVSRRVLETARAGIYREQDVQPVPEAMKKRYLLRSRDRSRRLVRVVPELRSGVRFDQLNFMAEFSLQGKMDILFLRNVLIYFERPDQERIVRKLCGHLNHGGYLFVGHSETLNGLQLPLAPVVTSVYRKTHRPAGAKGVAAR